MSRPNASDTGLRLDADARAGLAHASDLARRTGQTRWVAHVVPMPSVDVLAAYALAGTQDRFFWERVETGDAFCALGTVDEIESAGGRRFADVREWCEKVRSRIHWLGEPRAATAPLFVGGFGFEEDPPACEDWKAFPAARFVLPAILAERRREGTGWVVLARVEPGVSATVVERALQARLREAASTQPAQPGSTDASPRDKRSAVHADTTSWTTGPEYRVRSDRPHAVYMDQVARALDEIASGRLQKVVLARSLRVDHDGRLDVPAFLGRLRTIYGSCALIAMGRGDDTFLAATPETLVRLEGRRVGTAALAGSAPRGRTPDEDRAFGEALRASEKDGAEHAHVVQAIRTALAPFCDPLAIPATPRLRTLFGIQHLETTVEGQLRERAGEILDLVAALHPTPAVGGVPGPAARDWLRRFEGLERGWYAAPIGWLDGEGGGDFRVALRSALIRNFTHRERDLERADEDPDVSAEEGRSRAWLFAGAGIVAGSRPDQELAETRIKLRALLAPLTEI